MMMMAAAVVLVVFERKAHTKRGFPPWMGKSLQEMGNERAGVTHMGLFWGRRRCN